MRRPTGVMLALCLAALASRAAGAEGAQACWVEVALEPPRAVVGQQVLYRARIFSRAGVRSVEWSRPPIFPHFRTETLPGNPQPALATGAGMRARDERRALFAERPGEQPLRAPPLRCLLRDGSVERVPVPEVELPVAALPEAGRPEDFDGIVGPLTLHVTVTPRALALGESLRVAVMVRGTGNLWELAPPLSQSALADADLFEKRPELVLERGRSLFLRRHFVYDLVPRAVGTLRVPGIALPYFDPSSGRYRVARSDPVAVAVAPRTTPSPASPAPGSRSTPRPAARDGAGSPGLRWLAWLAPLLLAALVWLRRARARRDAPTARALRQLAEAEGDDDPIRRATAQGRALRAALADRVTDARTATPEELIAREGLEPAVCAAVHLLASVERARFDPQAPPPDPGRVRRAIEALHSAR